MELISVVIPVFNTKEYLPKLIDSLKNQSYGNIELVFVDDGSTDGSGELLKQQFKDYKNVKILENKCNKGTFLARYKGFLNCTGDYVCCIDSDDFVDYKFIETTLNYIKQNNCDVAMVNNIKASMYKNKLWPKQSPDRLKEQIFLDYQCLQNFLKYPNSFVPFILNGKLIKKQIINNIVNDLKPYLKICKNITMGEDCIYSALIYYYSKKVGISCKSCYFYIFHQGDQTTTVNTKQGAIKRMDGLFRSLNMIKEFLISKNVYEQFKQEYISYGKIWVLLTHSNCLKLDCLDKYNQLLKKYNLLELQ